MVAEHPVRPGARRQRRLVARDQRADLPRPPGRGQQVEVEGQLEAREVRAVVEHQPVDRQVGLADQHAVAGVVVGQRGAWRRWRRAPPAGPSCGRGPRGAPATCPVANPGWAGCRGRTRPRSGGGWRPRGSRPRRGPARSAARPAWPRAPPDCASSGPAAAAGRRGSSTGRSPRRRSRPGRRTRSASCWAARHPAPGRARCTSRASGCCARRGSRRTRGAGPSCGSARSRGSPAARARGPPRPAGRSRPGVPKSGSMPV